MSTFSSKDVGFLLLDGYSLLGTVTVLNTTVEAVLQDRLALGDSWGRSADTGIRKGSLSQSGFFDDATGSVNQALVDTNVGASRVFCYNLEGNTIGKTFVGFAGAIELKYERQLPLEKLHMAAATYNPSGSIDIGAIIHTHTAESGATGNTKASSVNRANDPLAQARPITSSSVANPTVITTPVAHGLTNLDQVVISGHTGSTPAVSGLYTATVTGTNTFTVPVNVAVGGTGGTVVRAWTKNGGNAYLQISALTLGGSTNFIPKIEHSADNAVWVDLVTFTAVTTAPGKECKVVASGTTINQYLAASWAYTGAGAGQSATFMVGFARA